MSLPLCFSVFLKCFIALGLAVKALIHFEVIVFVKIDKGQFHSVAYGYPGFPGPLVEKIVLSLLNDFDPIVKNHLTIYANIWFISRFSYSAGLYVYLYVYSRF